jgi:hypothetical protein
MIKYKRNKITKNQYKNKKDKEKNDFLYKIQDIFYKNLNCLNSISIILHQFLF